MPPRMLIRRSLALFIDLLLVSVVTTLLMYPLVLNNTDKIRFSNGSLRLTKCWQSKNGPQELIDIARGQAISKLIICQNKPFFILENGLTAELVFNINQSDNGNYKATATKSITLPIDSQGNPITPVSPQGMLDLFLVIVGSALLLSMKEGKTPGKRVMGIRVINVSRQAALRREFWRFFPIILFMPLTAMPAMPTLFLNLQIWHFLAIFVTVSVFLLWYYAYPMTRWNGALRHDTIAGTKVVRA